MPQKRKHKVKTLKLRPATIQDAQILRDWRNDPETRIASHNPSEISKEEHLAWLEKALSNRGYRVFIAEEGENPVGTVRAVYSEGVWVLSWIVAPSARGLSIAKQMVFLFAQEVKEPIRAEVKVGNTASVKIAENAGMKFTQEIDGFLHYYRDAMD